MCIISRFVCLHTVHKLSDLNNEANFNCLIYFCTKCNHYHPALYKMGGLQVSPTLSAHMQYTRVE